VIPNPWDVGSARLLAGAGFQALATTSAGAAAAHGVPDGRLTRDAVLTHVAAIAGATDLPVSADLEAGYGDDPEAVAATITAAVAAGCVGGSIEDLRPARGVLYDRQLAVERIRAAAEAARGLPHDVVLTARCEGMLTGETDLAATITRLQAYAAAGADVLYAPGLTTAQQIRAVVGAVDRPVNVVLGLGPLDLGLDELGALGVARVSVGSALARAAYGALLRAATEMRERGTFAFAADAVPYAELNRLLATAPATTHARTATSPGSAS
jgi:2-methylisocitrate lyase-like PEP mutase family enzyme